MELKIPFSFHTGTTGGGAGLVGGRGYHLKYIKPIPSIDDIAAAFPELAMIMMHPSIPWIGEFEAGGNKSEMMENVLYKNARMVPCLGL